MINYYYKSSYLGFMSSIKSIRKIHVLYPTYTLVWLLILQIMVVILHDYDQTTFVQSKELCDTLSGTCTILEFIGFVIINE